MPQLEEDELPESDQPSTAEQQGRKDPEDDPERAGVPSEYPPKLPPEALPTKD